MVTKEVTAVVSAYTDKEGVEHEQQSFTVSYNYPETVKEAIDAYGEPIVLSQFCQKLTVALQGGIRIHGKGGAIESAIQDWAFAWKPGMAKPKKSKLEKFDDLTESMGDDELMALVQRIKERKAANNG